MPRYMVERTFPAGALERLDEKAKRAVNMKNAEVGVKWVRSYANTDKTKTFCIYEGPNEEAIHEAAKRTEIPVDRIVEIPVDLTPQ